MSRKLDAAIAEALGYVVDYASTYEKGKIVENKLMPGIKRGIYSYGCPYYSTDGNAMIELDREMQEQGYCFRHIFINGANDFKVTYYTKNDDSFIGRASTMPLALALAAYKALMGMSEG